MKVKRSSDGITIITKNKDTNPSVFILIPFTFIWNFITLIAFFIALQSSSLVAIILISPFFIIGLILFYSIIIICFNRITMFVNNEIITINDQPIPNPFFNEKLIRTDKLKFLYITELFNGHDLTAFMKSGARKKLLTFLSKDEASSIKQILENKLDIEIKLDTISEYEINGNLPSA